MTTVVCWNMKRRKKPWRRLVEMGADVALLQETTHLVPPDVADRVDVGPLVEQGAWDPRESKRDFSGRRWPKIAKLSNRVEVEWFKPVTPIGPRSEDTIRISDIQTCARLTGEGQPVEVRRKEGVTNHFRPESCAGRCEAAGEALTGVRTGRAIEHRKVACLERRDRVCGRRQHRHHRDGEGMEGSTVSENPCTFVRPSSGPGRSSFCPGSPPGAAEGRRIPQPDGVRNEEVG